MLAGDKRRRHHRGRHAEATSITPVAEAQPH
jgi:hypothetical protein